MKITVGRPSELGGPELELWRAWQHADPRLASPFLAPEFAVAMAHHNDSVRVAVLSDGNATAGFLPFEHHPGGVGRALAYGLADLQALVARPGLEWSMPEVMAGCGLSVFEFDHLVDHQVSAWGPREVSRHASPVIDLTGDLDSWLAQKRRNSPSRMKKTLQHERRMARELGELDFTFDTRSDAELRRLIAWKGAQYVRTGRVNRFAKPWFRAFIEELFATPSEHFALSLGRLRAGDRTVALHLFLRGNGIVTGWFPAYDPEVAAYSPGLACWLGLIRIGRDHGIARIDLGSGEHDYKSLFADSEDQVAVGISERPGGAALLRRVTTAPRRIATDVVLSSPRLRVAARETLGHLGRLRTKLS